jgi:hypothetical protein
MLRWSGFAEFAFDDARLAFARAAELADTDAHELHPEAWVVDDQRVTFSLDAESSRPVLEGMKRFLGLLALQAQRGEAVIEVEQPLERWVRRAATPSVSKELALDPDAPASRTIRASSA